MKVQTANRQNYIDWLRVGAMGLLLFYHSGRLFDEPAWHIKNAVLNTGIHVFNRFLDVWHMPLFFLLAGASVWFALEHRTPGGFSKERVLRLFVPLIFAMLIIVPPQVYIQRISEGDFAGSFLAWWPHTFSGPYSMDNPATGNLSWHHLWFLAYLFVFSLLLLPVFWYFRRARSKPVIDRAARFFQKPGAIFLPAIPLIAVNIVLRPTFGWGNQNLISDWANFFFYGLTVLYGFLLVSDARILGTIQRNTVVSLAAALVLSAPIALVQAEAIQLPEFAYMTVIAAACWSWLLAIVAVGSRVLNFSNRLLKYASDAVLPVYILHQTIIVVLGYYVIKWDTGVIVKYPIIVAATLVGSLAIYEVVRRTAVTRFLFGMRVGRAKTGKLIAATAKVEAG